MSYSIQDQAICLSYVSQAAFTLFERYNTIQIDKQRQKFVYFYKNGRTLRFGTRNHLQRLNPRDVKSDRAIRYNLEKHAWRQRSLHRQEDITASGRYFSSVFHIVTCCNPR